MDWASDDFGFTDNDLRLFQYEERASVVIQRSTCDESFHSEEVVSEAGWAEWFKTVSPEYTLIMFDMDAHRCIQSVPTDTTAPKICLIICSRAKNFSKDEASPLYYLPFSRSTFKDILSKFRIHRTTARTVSLLTCRTSPAWSNDVAMTLTHSPQTKTTFAIVFGCSEMQRRQIEGRLKGVTPMALAHPMLLPGILAELERKRLTGLVEYTLDRFTLRAGGTSMVAGGRVGTLHMSEEQMGQYLELCYESQSLAKEIKSVKRQLFKMMQSCDIPYPAASCPDTRDGGSVAAETMQDALADVGTRIKKRTLEIMDLYDNKIDECSMVLDNTSITMQTIWNHIARHDAAVNTKISIANTSIALDSKQDNAQMRSIALLTMIYLPVSAIASVFSMGIFDWSSKGTVVSKYIWIFVVLSLGLTIITVLVWYLATRTIKKKDDGAFEELGMTGPETS
ncbi:hypothetical protein BKA56DRAFT_674268 [Ilyonectria sp. MPI-CAGE-AT-0026]|nr:hypothetical protein BKA56DRAFT_674268 [Ilyonectria sp. MPI-CAGE-AT-0026]